MPLPSKKFLRYVLITTIVLAVSGIVAFYVVLNKQKQTITEQDIARGVYAEGGRAPSFEGAGSGKIQNDISALSTTTESAQGAGEAARNAPPRLWQAARSPVAGFGFVEDAASSRIYFAERASGYIFSADPMTGIVARLSNRLFPKIYEAFFDSSGNAILRSINEDGVITTFSGTVSSSTLSGKYLENDIEALSINTKTGELFYSKSDLSGETVGISASRDGEKQKNIFSSPLSNWRPVFSPDGKVFVIQKPSDDTFGYAYEVKDGVLSPVLREIPGLTFLPKAGSSAALFATSQGGTIQLYSSADNSAAALPLKTLADKCVWASSSAGSERALSAYCAVPRIIPSQNFLNDRNMGAVHTSDDWWKINASDGTVEFLYSPGEGMELDVENPAINDENETIAFMNAADKTLWVLRIAEKAN